MIRIDNDTVFYTPYDEEEISIGSLKEASVLNGYMYLGGHGFALENYPVLQAEWDKLPKKPVPELPPKIITEEEKAADLLKVIALNIMNNDELLKTFGIEPRQDQPPK